MSLSIAFLFFKKKKKKWEDLIQKLRENNEAVNHPKANTNLFLKSYDSDNDKGIMMMQE